MQLKKVAKFSLMICNFNVLINVGQFVDLLRTFGSNFLKLFKILEPMLLNFSFLKRTCNLSFDI